ncbi:endonuclease domain-containing protein [Aeromonas veronii]|uniref:endonuclease domain-containing protein n=1 Tax=Aeromonas TaxID=642 RepID=UPI001C210D2A|nr:MULTISPECIES: endonuclease domain-containing protein [Aeromonas]EKP0300976.1 endonuclease domain-containing protein [Aeromonas veronii]QWZ86573.1 endonuclease domain-containing protein [Aeromonas sp. FDAARGOS 1404]UZE58868.1 endonuclease domain-containing protein [Aeromonas veronii]HDN9002985.1 endonuclease domain-containing protein [Aeromonas veronii AMC24]
MESNRVAKRLRRDATQAEQKLWQQLRNRRLAGLKFRRQMPIGPYVVDFICLEQGLVIEVDGWQHGTQTNQMHDEARTAYLNQQGFRVIRVWNNDVLSRMEVVLAHIWLSLR